jgi:lysophospholipase L1-like esterase
MIAWMHTRLLVALCALLVPASAAAGLRVMCYGDSITAGHGDGSAESSYPAHLQRQRPDLEVVNEGHPGDVSGNLERFRAALTDWPPQLVVLMLGTNDPVCTPDATPGCDSTATPEGTVVNLFRMADEARAAGAQVVILTPPPVACNAGCEARHDVAFATTMRHAFTARVADELLRARLPAGVRVANLRGRFTDASWLSLSLDGLHPSAEGNRIIAEFVAARIPKSESPRAKRDTRRQVAREPAQVAPQPAQAAPPAPEAAPQPAQAAPPPAPAGQPPPRGGREAAPESDPFVRRPQAGTPR